MSDTKLPEEYQRLISRARVKDRGRVRERLEELVERGILTFEDLIGRLPEMATDERWTPLEVLVFFGKGRAIPALLKLVDNPAVPHRSQLLWYFDRMGGERAFQALVRLMRTDVEVDVRAQAAYRLHWLFDLCACDPLMGVLENRAEEPRVRAEAAEGIGFLLDRSDRRTRLFKRATRLLIETLRDPAPEVRFWSCYALGTMRAHAALSALRELAETDDAMCPGWWRVGEEAGDAVGVVLGGCFPDRMPASWSACGLPG